MYNTPINDIIYEDIENFVTQGNEESIILDYKGNWPKDLDKTIAAMANTQGGVVLIGVAEEEKTGRPEEIIGVELGAGEDALRQRVFNTAYQGIYPPVIPEVAVCPLVANSDRAVVVIRVSQSDQTPHAIDQRRRIYVRVDSQSRPHSLATIHELEWLWNRRHQAEEKMQYMIQSAQERAAWMLEDVSLPILRVWIAPRFSTGQEVFAQAGIQELLKSIIGTDIIISNVASTFPRYTDKSRSIPSGHCLYRYEPIKLPNSFRYPFEYVELTTSGLLFTELRMPDMTLDTSSLAKNHHSIWIDWLLSQIDGLLKFSANRAYPQGDYWGLLRVQASLHNVQGVILEDITHRTTSEMNVSPNKIVNILDETLNKDALEESRGELVKQAAYAILWAFGYGHGQEWFEQWFSQVWRRD